MLNQCQSLLSQNNIEGHILWITDFGTQWNMIGDRYIGVYISPLKHQCAIRPPTDTLKGDSIRLYEIKKFCLLASKASPIVIEVMLRDSLDCYVDEAARDLMRLRDLFFSPFAYANLLCASSGKMGKFSKYNEKKKIKYTEKDGDLLETSYRLLVEVECMLRRAYFVHRDEDDEIVERMRRADDKQEFIDMINERITALQDRLLTPEQKSEIPEDMHMDKISRAILYNNFDETFLLAELNPLLISLRRTFQ
eukprot:TRINITY_DN4959_c0_g1_i1.p1 TRINITY_DN4959_c0_g1~~TRINITY_DN4959_c0_g1_i1.p1  ORF type:complete len:251 (-),score=46.23 TRINITY_DN4959_c0_g1_i1:56-808(-)